MVPSLHPHPTQEKNRGLMNDETEESRNGNLDDRWEYNTWPYEVDWKKVPKEFRSWVKIKFNYVVNIEYKNKLGDCIHLCERSSCPKHIRNSGNYVKITFEPTGCWSSVGMEKGEQVVNLQFPTCIGNKGTMAHEIMHSLGFYHEQSRPDRDGYVKIVMGNVKSGKEGNFERQSDASTEMYDLYDWNSVMHYDTYAFRNKDWGGVGAVLTRTIYPNPLAWESIKAQTENWGRGAYMGQRIGLSFCDELKIRRHYSKPGLKGGEGCNIWTPRTCRCKYIDKSKDYDDAKCQDLILNDPANNITRSSGSNPQPLTALLITVFYLII
ncbi:zinc metalloproteinase nas-4 isoform X2 [Eurytemora carolleeae]|nr:zinc metalloproteinase nas-4 isoform X2 [Eurytemora carolleeae]|eukprot:XP_023349589.1 zinc metalloproteinase nas-4-like isoform X2 [Eurytemora affinis]